MLTDEGIARITEKNAMTVLTLQAVIVQYESVTARFDNVTQQFDDIVARFEVAVKLLVDKYSNVDSQ